MAFFPYITASKLETFNAFTLITFTAFSLWLWSAILGCFYSTIVNDVDLLESDRTYDSKVYFWGNDFRNKFGEWYGYTLYTHVITALIITALIAISALNMFFPAQFGGLGTQFHRWFGLVYIVVWMIHMIDGMIPAFALTVNRGLSPCQYVNDEQLKAHSPHSFSVIFFVHVLYWIFRINENISYGLCSYVLTHKINKIKWVQCSLVFLSASSILLVVARIIILLGWIVYFQQVPIPCVNALPFVFWCCVYVLEVPTVLASLQNVKYMLFNVTEMEVVATDDIDREQQSSTSVIRRALSRGLTFVNDFDSWKHHHRYNMKLSVFTTFRTFVASVVYKIDPLCTSVWYLATSVMYVGYFVYYNKIAKPSSTGKAKEIVYVKGKEEEEEDEDVEGTEVEC